MKCRFDEVIMDNQTQNLESRGEQYSMENMPDYPLLGNETWKLQYSDFSVTSA